MTNKNKLNSSNSIMPHAVEPEDISIVMAVYNHEDTVAEALESALMQEMPYSSVIYCLNDASTDNSAEILSDYAGRYPGKIKVFTSPENLGSGKKSMLYHKPPVNGRYWCLLEGDDYWTRRDKLKKQILFLDNSNADYVGCSCNTLVKNEVTGKESVIKPDRDAWNLIDLLTLKEIYGFYVHTSSVVWRNLYMDQESFLPPTLRAKEAYGDVMLMHMMLYRGGKIHNIPEVMSCYRVTGRGIWTALSEEDKAVANRKIAEVISHTLPVKYKILVYLKTLWLRLKRKIYREAQIQ